MSTILLIIGAVLLISTFGIYSRMKNESIEGIIPMYSLKPLMTAIAWISGFVLPVVAWANIIEFHWLVLFFINIPVVWFLGPWLTKGFLVRFASGKGLDKDFSTALAAGVIALAIGLILK